MSNMFPNGVGSGEFVQNVSAQPNTPPIVQMGMPYQGPGSSSSSVHAFAGHGVYVGRQSWLLSEQATNVSSMLTTSFDIVRRRNIYGLRITPENLQEYNTYTELRHYLILKRGIATVFLYIAPAGNDMYISRTTTVLMQIDGTKVFLLVMLIVIAFIAMITIIGLPLAGLIGAFLIWQGFRSFRYYLRERDFWVYLRKQELNDFQLDDIALLEDVTNETIRAAAKQLKIDSSKIVDPQKGFEHERKIRVV